jgi:hypothetical protein
MQVFGINSLELLRSICNEHQDTSTPSAAIDWFGDHLEDHLKRTCSADELATFIAMQRLAFISLDLARHRLLQPARKHLIDAFRKSRRLQSGSILRRLASALLLAQMAYIFYRERRFDKALTCLSLSDVYDATVAVDLPSVVAHRLQIMHNRIRVFACAGRESEALVASLLLLTILEKPQNLPVELRLFDLPFQVMDVVALPASLRSGLHAQIASDMVAIWAGASPTFRDGFIYSIRPHPILRSANDTQVANWMRFQCCHTSSRRQKIALAHRAIRRRDRPSAPFLRSACLEITSWLETDRGSSELREGEPGVDHTVRCRPTD